VTLDLRAVDARDETALRAWWGCGHETSLECPHDFWLPWVSRVAGSEVRWPELQAWCEEKQGDCRILEWGNTVPDDLVADYAALLTGFMDEIPLGDLDLDLDLESSEWTPERIRTNEQRIREIGRDASCCAAIAPDGTLCGVTDLRVPQADARVAHVASPTCWTPTGHRLGLHLKLTAQRSLRGVPRERACGHRQRRR